MTVLQLEIMVLGCVAIATLASGVSMVLAMRKAR